MRKAGFKWKHRIARNFDRAALSYETNSPVQKQSANILSELICQNMACKNISILEFGCGTGYLTRELYQDMRDADWLISDISPQMVAKCMENMPEGPNLKYTIVDAEELDRTERYDLICSNLTAQWFEDTHSAFQNLISHLKPGGVMAVSTLGPNTFSLWRKSFTAAGQDHVMPDYMAMDDLRALLPEEGQVEITEKKLTADYNSAYEFAHALKDIGAHAHAKGRQYLNPGAVRAILRNFEDLHQDEPVIADYEIYFLLYRKPAE